MPYSSSYFFGQKFSKIKNRSHLNNRNSKFFRKFFYKNSSLGVDYSFIKRIPSGEYFPMRLWFMRYDGWLLISAHWFKPVKKRVNRLKSYSPISSGASASLLINQFSKRVKLNRPKAIIVLFLKSLNMTLPYSF